MKRERKAMKYPSLLVLVCALCFPAFAAEAPPAEALTEFLAKWKALWNKADAEGIYKLYHPDTIDLLVYRKADDAKKTAMAKEFHESMKAIGTIKSIGIGKFIDRTGCRVLKIEYENLGLIAGTMALKKDAQGNWMVLEFRLGGQGEPELKE
jgi:hypothetical protein